MLELICSCGSTLKMMNDNPSVIEMWLQYHQQHCDSQKVFSDSPITILEKSTFNVFTGETL